MSDCPVCAAQQRKSDEADLHARLLNLLERQSLHWILSADKIVEEQIAVFKQWQKEQS